MGKKKTRKPESPIPQGAQRHSKQKRLAIDLQERGNNLRKKDKKI